jgi:signal transduction histidine kinase
MQFRKKLAFITVVYWFLLVYITAALVWWFISLSQQNSEMAMLRIAQLDKTAPDFGKKLLEANDFRRRKEAQYIGEGVMFMLLIFVGAIFVYRATRKQLQLGQQQQNFMMAITHELKTPIAVARLNVQTLQKRKLNEDQTRNILDKTLLETDRLNDLTNNILLASRLDGGKQVQHKEEFDFEKVIRDLVVSMETRYPERNFEVRLAGPLLFSGDQLLIKIMLSNLVDNAVKYAEKGTPISIEASASGHQLVLQILDNGSGIPDSEKKRVFEKFYRMGNEATRQTKGTGLGLYLCQRIAVEHGGKISIFDNTPTGTILKIILPKAEGFLAKSNKSEA